MDSLGLATVISCIDQYQMHIIFNFYLLLRDNLICRLHYDIEMLHAPPKPKRVGQSKEVLHLWEDEERGEQYDKYDELCLLPTTNKFPSKASEPRRDHRMLLRR